MIQLPKSKIKAETLNAKTLVIFGKPKSGKSSICANLDNNLIIDLESGYAHLDALKVSANNITELGLVAKAIQEANTEAGGYAYKYITIDNATKLEEIVKELALQLYKASPVGKAYSGEDVLKLPNGAGYMWLREAFFKVLDMFKSLSKHLIIVAHTRDSLINREGKEMSELSIDLSGKIARLVAADCDALGYLYRQKNQTILSFNGGGDFIAEARPVHLRGQEIVIAESNDSGQIEYYWDRVYLPE
jgi:hypothetical protein